MTPMIRLAREGTVFTGSPDDLAALTSTYRTHHWLRLPQLVAPNLLQRVKDSLRDEPFVPREHAGIGKELSTGAGGALAVLTFLLNDQRLFDLIGDITGCDDIQCFTGRIYRMDPDSEHYDSWHDDLTGHRRVAMSLNLAEEEHQGGVLQIRDRVSKEILQEVHNTTYGDAVIFKLAPELQHRVTAVVGGAPRMAFAGWFRSQPSIRELLSPTIVAS
jgi:hypothetical protein